MEVRFAPRAVRLAAVTLLGLAPAASGRAEDQVISLDSIAPPTTELVVSDSADAGMPSDRPTALPPVVDDSAVIDPAVEPAAATQHIYGGEARGATWANWLADAEGAKRPPKSAGSKSKSKKSSKSGQSHGQSRHGSQSQQMTRETAKNASPLKSSPAATEKVVEAHRLSQSADSQTEYSQVVKLVAEATRIGLDEQSRKFALELSAWALNRRGQLRADENQAELAMADFNAAIEFDPNCWRAYHNRGVSLAQSGKFAEAFDDVCRVVAINPQFAKGLSNRAMLYTQAGDRKHAEADFDAALALEPTLVPALVGKARLCHLSGELDAALECFNAAAEQAPTDATIVCSRADLLADLGKYREAMLDYAKAIELNPRMEHAYRNGAWLLATCPDDQIRNADGALAGAKKALQCGYGERHAALDTLAAALATAGKYEEAVGTLEQAIEIAPPAVRPAYQARLSLYESRQPFRTEPPSAVKAVEYVVGDGK